MSDKTVLFDLHEQLGATIVDFHGWLLPLRYEGILAEHKCCRESACVFDTCHMGQFSVSGPGAADSLDRVLTQRASALKPGRCKYGLLLNEEAGILDDTILMRLDEDDFLLVVNAGTRQKDFQWLQAHLGSNVSLEERDVSLEDKSSAWGKIDLQGPASYEVLRSLIGQQRPRLVYFAARRTDFLGRQCVLSRTGYTGELGYEIFLPSDALADVFGRLVEHPLVSPAGLGARDLLRLEMCYPLYGQDISEKANPLEADMDRFLNLRRTFIGSGALEETAKRETARRLIAFRGEGRRRAESGQEISAEGDATVGTVTSALFSPSLGVSIGLGYVATEFSREGTQLSINHPRGPLAVTVAAKPLYNRGTCRNIDAFGGYTE